MVRRRVDIVGELTAAKELIKDSRNWTRGTEHCVDYDGTHRYCARGALKAVKAHRETFVALDNAVPVPFTTYVQYNDLNTHWLVMQLFDKAIAANTEPAKANHIGDIEEIIIVPEPMKVPDFVPEQPAPVKEPAKEPVPV